MIRLEPEHSDELRALLPAEKPCGVVLHHVLATGFGSFWVDRFPGPRAAIGVTGGNVAFAGGPGTFDPAALPAVFDEELESWDHLFIDAEGYEDLVRAAMGVLQRWPRVQYDWREGTPAPALEHESVRRLTARDAGALAGLSESILWIHDTSGGPEACARLETAFGAFDGERLVSVAVPFYVGSRYEELGVVTEPSHRGRGLSPLCAAAVARDVLSRGRLPSWATTPDNRASQRVAEKLGFHHWRDVMHRMIGPPLSGTLPAEAE